MPNYLSNRRPDFKPFTLNCGNIPAYGFQGDLASELQAKRLTPAQALDLLEDMLMVREVEDMIVRLRSGAYEPIPTFNYRGPTHVSIGQEGTAVGACSALRLLDKITSTHRGHGDSLAKGAVAIRQMNAEQRRARVPGSTKKGAGLLEEVLEDHVYRTIAELFGKEDGYCKGRGGGMHIADFRIGHLGANAIVGGGVPIATGAAMAMRYQRSDGVICCFAGDGAYANGVVLEALNWAAQVQWTNHLAKKHAFGLPIIFLVQNNQYGMTGRAEDEVMGVKNLARRAAGFADNNMHAEIVNGMDVLAVRDVVARAAERCRRGQGPVLLEVNTYRYYGHSLGDPRMEYRTKDEEAAWRAVDAIATYKQQLLAARAATADELAAIEQRVKDRNARAAVRAAHAADPVAADVIKYMYTDTQANVVPAEFRKVTLIQKDAAKVKRDKDGQINYRDAIKEGLVEEMLRDNRVVLYGEDVAEYGNAFKLTKGLLETFGRERVFNTPISEACICGTAVGAAMAGLRPVAELMYMDFALMASDQISNQAAKWHYMSGAQTKVPLVIRASVGGGKGYGGQHSQTLESVFAHIPGLYVVYPATPYDAKGLIKAAIRDDNPVMFVESQLIKAAIRDDNPVMFVESQLLYSEKGVVPEEDYVVPIGVADVKRAGRDITFVGWGPAILDALKAAEQLAAEGVEAEVVDIRSLVPLDLDTILRSVAKTGKCVVVSQAISIGSFTGEIASLIMEHIFDELDAPVLRVGARNGIAPQSHILEAAFLPNVNDILAAAKKIL
ncbi:MAG: dehydrogenase E1 component subunit alpha/beta [Kiritimatiellaeota bacterium]|nr:dehydrogenase E1 component subunit alpha/beta [Kiritimatiellota bacterium]